MLGLKAGMLLGKEQGRSRGKRLGWSWGREGRSWLSQGQTGGVLLRRRDGLGWGRPGWSQGEEEDHGCPR